MFSLTIVELQGIIPKLMALQRDGSNIQEKTLKDLPHWEQKGLGPSLT
jgi:hypothetical protein